MPSDLIQVFTTTAEQSDAQTIATLLVEKRLAACVQISGPLESSYWWNDRIQTAREWQVLVKTQSDMYDEVEAAIRSVHPYDEPEILALPVVAVSSGYRSWLTAQLAIPPKKPAELPPGEAEPLPAKTTGSTLTRPKRTKKKAPEPDA